MSRNPPSNVGVFLVVDFSDQIRSSDFNQGALGTLGLRIVTELFDESNKVFDDGNTSVLGSFFEVFDGLLGKTQRTGQVFRHDVSSLWNIDIGKDMGIRNELFIAFSFPIGSHLERIFLFGFKVEFINRFLEVQVPVRTFERSRFATAVGGLPSLWRYLVSQVSDTIEVLEGSDLGMGFDDSRIDFVINLVRSSVEET